jgi:predicted TPR repeat methyltransferase
MSLSSDASADTAPAPAPAPAPELGPDGKPVREVSLAEFLEIAQREQRAGHLDVAESMYLTVLRELPDEPTALNYLGVLRHQHGDKERALATLTRAIEVSPGDSRPWLNLASVLISQGAFDDAVKALDNVISLSPDNPLAYNNLGVLHMRRGNLAAAEEVLNRGLALAPERADLHHNLAQVYRATGRLDDSVRFITRAIALGGIGGLSRKLLTIALHASGDKEGALRAAREWVQESPDDPESHHHLAAVGGTDVPTRATDDYVKSVFDRFAGSFDSHLGKLGYRAPELVVDEMKRITEHLGLGGPVVLDAGCGTGLCAPLLRPLAERLEGVDLSAGMLDRARERGGYDALYEAELVAFLNARPDTYNAIVSADVLVYFGDIDALIASVARSLKPGGILVFTVEVLDAADHRPGYELQFHGRYAHTAAFVANVLTRHGLTLLHLSREALRHELTIPVQGLLVSAGRAPQDLSTGAAASPPGDQPPATAA